jgi:hypothetical protein
MGDLYPGGPAQPINFSITNPSGGKEYVNTVTISVATDPSGLVETVPGDSGSGVTGCYADWFTVSPASISFARELAPGTTSYYGDASISMMDEPFSQDACQGITVGLNFSSN